MLGVTPSPDINVGLRRSSVNTAVAGHGSSSISTNTASISSTALASTPLASTPSVTPQTISVPKSPAKSSFAPATSDLSASAGSELNQTAEGSVTAPPSFSLNLGPLTISGVPNAALNPNIVTEQAQESIGPDATNKGDTAGYNPTVTDKQPLEPIFTNSQDTEDATESETKEKEQSESKASISQEEQLLAQLSSRDAEVRAHEQAHSAVGGYLAQSPKFSYEQGSDGRRYAVDGEVQIDISVVSGDPQATVTKMQKVYAAAMAPTSPSMADIRVATEALKKLNIAKAELVEIRQSKVLSLDESESLVEAKNAIEGVVFPAPHKSQVSGEVDANGGISASMVDSPSTIDDKQTISPAIKQINQQLAETSLNDAGGLSHASEHISARYAANNTLQSQGRGGFSASV